uniref:Peptidase S1 domain-containing protein n=1 Tax=Leptocylindrus danicus TaxID=163516 RepID=A0A7S2NYB0_9STRA|mmetsp:Transcript_16931/g.25140  ORF Transcript_16931/g.25140 Transcript_16931/m.25140 type:complete len:886 (+) Transcript_16931:266-2923(+)
MRPPNKGPHKTIFSSTAKSTQQASKQATMTQYAIAASILLSRLIATDAARGTANHPFAIPPRNLAVSPRVVNGDDVGSHTNHPYMVSLQEGEVGGYGSHYCGASLIAPDIILTAAHCGPIPGNDKVQIGRYDLSNSTESTFEEFAVFDVFYHPGWGTKGIDNDFAIVQIDGRSNMDPVTIDDGSVELASGTDLRIIGWGLTETGFIADVLQEGVVDYVANTDCNAIWQYEAGAEVTDNMMCAMRSGEEFVVDACNGDSGGPLITTDGNAVQVGLVSWGAPFPCESNTLPGVYARISAAYDWILEVTCKHSKYGHPDCAPTTSPSPTTSLAPTSLCVDVPGWVDLHNNGCSWYEQEMDEDYFYDDSVHWCLYFEGTPTSGISVYEACCVCGGGMNLDLDQPTDAPSVSMQPTTTQSPSVSPTVSAKPTSSSAPTETCVDVPDWIDVYGDDCSFYSEEIVDDLFSYYYDDGMTKCDLWGDIPDAETELVTANMACCECGGGAHTIPTPSPTLSLEPTKSMAPTSLCYDIPDWVAEEIFTCDFFHVEFADTTATTLCEFLGEVEDNNGVNAIEACCACGGGMMRDLDAPSNSPTATFAPTLSTKPSAAPTVSAAPSVSAAPTEECFDKEDWVDYVGDDCSWYAEDASGEDDFWINRQRQRKLEQELYDDDYFYESLSRCEEHGDSTDFNGDISANMACCVCGGGAHAVPTPFPTVSMSPTLSPAPTTECQDHEWSANMGSWDMHCVDLSEDSEGEVGVSLCDIYGYLADSSGTDVLARDACCVCGGGQDRQIDPPEAASSSPIATPTATPSANPSANPTANPTVTPSVTPSTAPSTTPNSSPNTPSTSAPATPSSNVSSSASMFGTNGFSLLFTCSVTWFVYYLFSGV